MSVRNAVALGILLGITLFIIYLSVADHSEQQMLQTDIAPTRKEKIMSSPKPPFIQTPSVTVANAPFEPLQQNQKTTEVAGESSSDSRQAAAAPRDPAVACPKMKKRFEVVPGVSWGSLPTELQKLWTNLNCDEFMNSGSTGEAASISQPTKSKFEENISFDTDNASEDPKESSAWCWRMRTKHEVKPLKSWGSLPSHHITTWKKYNCDLIFSSQRMGKRVISTCNPSNVEMTAEFPNFAKSLPLIAIMAATTTRKIHNPSTKSLALFNFLLPSLIRSVDCGYRYEYVLGYDEGDPYYDSASGNKEVQKWFAENIEQIMYKNGISIILRFVKVKNTLKKPGPVFIEMARTAYRDGAEYFYRVNDDTELTAVWPKAFVKSLQTLGAPFGVVGPRCDQGNQRILTHDFVHRLHMEIFDMNYYPPQLTDWWMDDWISFVYGQTRTFKAQQISVIHHTGAHGQRYEVDHSHADLLDSLVVSGRQTIRKYILKSLNESLLIRFDKDIFTAGFQHRDIPAVVKESLQ